MASHELLHFTKSRVQLPELSVTIAVAVIHYYTSDSITALWMPTAKRQDGIDSTCKQYNSFAALWYPDFTEYNPSRVKGQILLSAFPASIGVARIILLILLSTPILILSTFHERPSLLIRSLTFKFLLPSAVGKYHGF
ncbi:uncharacterized protein G2W53_013873 [Senna tora]|uniref:Uncharacterized protein n=1 Tax=Senna tora TaxID=362788 RepID=A0A834TZQ1_9FABA|nr:uncharacterized protein G2W53_013873 [Senna tora]